MARIFVVGIANLHNLGDFLIYYCTIKILRKYLRNETITFLFPRSNNLYLPKELKELYINERVSFLSFTYDYTLLRKIITAIAVSPKTSRLNKNLVLTTWYIFDQIEKTYDLDIDYSADFVVFGGHTYWVFNPIFTALYNSFRYKAEKMIAFPLSVSVFGLNRYGYHELIRQKVLNNMGKFDYIYTRGRFSYKILKSFGINEERLGIALDPAFYIRKVFPHGINKNRSKLRVSVTPRKDMFINKEDYLQYASNLLNFIIRLRREFDIEIYLTSLAFDADYEAIKDIMHNLKLFTDLEFQVVKFTSLKDALQFYNTIDIMITSRLHDGILGISASKPVIFIFPHDSKILDVLSMLGPEFKFNWIYPNDPHMSVRLLQNVKYLIGNYKSFKKELENRIEKLIPTTETIAEKIKEMV